MFEIVDRLTGQVLTELPAEVLSGQLFIRGHFEADRGEQQSDDLLVGSGDSSSAVRFGDSGARVVVIGQSETPSNLSASVEIGQNLQELADHTADWAELAGVCDPLVSRRQIGELLDPMPMEDVLRQSLPDLRQVFFEPEAELHHERVRVPVGRARRISRRASQVLATHSEDWLRMSASGVIPRQVESLVRHEVIDIYENRVAARLADAVRHHLRLRLGLLRGLEELVGHEVVGWWRRQDRLTTLWGSNYADDDLKDQVDLRRAELMDLLGSVERLRDGPLYSNVPRRARVSLPIRFTNLLADDPNYRHVGKLWRCWWQSRGGEDTPAARRRRQLAESHAFMEFAELLLHRSLLNVGQVEGTSGRVIRGVWGSVGIRTSDVPGCWTVFGEPMIGEGWQRRVVALPLDLTSVTDAEARRWFDAIQAAVGDSDCIVLYAASGADIRRMPDVLRHHLEGVPLESASRSSWLIPVSPLDLESHDRVQQALNAIVVPANFRGYPVQVSFPDAFRSLLESHDWLAPGSQPNRVVVISGPRSDQVAQFKLDIEREIRSLRARPGGLGARDADSLEAAIDDIADTVNRFRCLVTCLTCGGEGRFEARQADTFEARCEGCGTRWGLRHEAVTQSRIPYLFVDDDGPTAGIDAHRWFGADLVASPCRSRIRPYGSGVIDPSNGRCTEFGTAAVDECERCAHFVSGTD